MSSLEMDSEKHGAAGAESSPRSEIWLRLIALFKLFKGVLLLLVGIGALSLLHRDVGAQVSHWINLIRVDPDNHYLHGLIAKLSVVDDRKLEEISAGTFFYAALLLTEGTGLMLRKRWAEYFTVVTTVSLIPLEILEITHRVSLTRITILIVNVAIVWYLVERLRRSGKAEPA